MELLITVENLHRVCRFCLKESTEMRPIFRHETGDDVKLLIGGFGSNDNISEVTVVSNEDIVEMISKCIGLEISHTDGLPMYLCNECHRQLRNSFEFRKKCIATVEYISNILKDSHEVSIKNEQMPNEADDSTIYFTDTNNFVNHTDNKHVNITVDTQSFLLNDTKENITLKIPSNNDCTQQHQSTTLDRRKEHVTVKKLNVKHRPMKNCDDNKPKRRYRRRPRPLDTVLNNTVVANTVENNHNDSYDVDAHGDADTDKKLVNSRRHRNKPEQCDICGFISRSLKSHMLVHTQVKNYECDFCGKKFSLRASLKNHIFAHINIRPFKCTLCHQTFITSCKRKNHMITHTGERNFSCSVCGKRFAQSGPRDVHLLTHSQIRQHKCEYCDKLFLLKHQLRNHIGIHTGERSYACGLCPMTFINSSGVSSHRRIHKEKNEYRCQICQMKIKELRFLKIHVKEHLPKLLVKPVIAPTDPHEDMPHREDPIYNFTKMTKETIGDFKEVTMATPIIADNFFYNC